MLAFGRNFAAPGVRLQLMMVLLLIVCSSSSAASSPSELEHSGLRTGDSGSSNTAREGEGAETLKQTADSLVFWPFPPRDKNTSNSDSCTDQLTCEDCNTERLCHWCSFDEACHTIGSVHGCFKGSSCLPPPPPKNDTSCLSHTNCAECTLSSKLCHWCAHDNACHEVGSPYGCMTGVDCYDNAHCQRSVPEPIEQGTSWFEGVGILPLVVILSVAGCSLCCTTMCCCVMGGVKGAYDDLTDLATSPQEEELQEPLLVQPQERQQTGQPSAAPQAEAQPGEEDGEGEIAQENADMQQLLQEEQVDAAQPEDYVRIVETENSNVQQPEPVPASGSTTERRRRHRRRVGRSMQRLYNSCVCCYLLSVVAITLFAGGSIRYFPKAPLFNVCNDAVAWKSLIDSVTAMKVQADIELLASISNPNHFDASLDNANGTFIHDGKIAGKIEIRPTTIAATSITDVLMVASFAPETWEALDIAKEFYQGTLVLHVALDMAIRVPALLDYEFTVSIQDMAVHVNEQSDRSLCACPSWSDPPNKSMQLPVPHWMTE